MHAFSPASSRVRRVHDLIATLNDIFTHRKFRQCEADQDGPRPLHRNHRTVFYSHLAVFYGFLGLVVTTTSVGIGLYAFGYLTPWPLWHPVKILGNLSGAAVLLACAVFIAKKLTDRKNDGQGSYTDWLFLGLLTLTTLTGFLSEMLRLAAIPPLAYWGYFIHLVCIFALLVYLPYTKFAHLAYRFAALLFTAARDSTLSSPRRAERS